MFNNHLKKSIYPLFIVIAFTVKPSFISSLAPFTMTSYQHLEQPTLLRIGQSIFNPPDDGQPKPGSTKGLC
jgi:hypothetical protein